MLGEIVVDDERVLTVVAIVFAHRGAGVRGEELQRRRLRRAGRYHDGVAHGAVRLELGHNFGHCRSLLTDGDVDALYVIVLLVDDRVDGDSRLAGLSVADDELALAATDRHVGVDDLDACLQGFEDRLALDDAWGLALNRQGLTRLDVALAVERLTQRIDDAAEQFVAHRHLDDAPGPF